MEPDRISDVRHNTGLLELLQILVLALSVTGLCYYCYYLMAPWIWSQNIPFRPEDLMPLVLEAAAEHDGIEIYVLYVMVFLSSFTTLFLSRFVDRIPLKSAQIIIFAFCAIISFFYIRAIGFTPPMSNVTALTLTAIFQKSLLPFLISAVFLACMLYLRLKSPRTVTLLSAILLVPICFIATTPISRYDYSFIFSPTLRLLNGAALRDIYFQYDLLPSLLALPWMKLGLDLNWFQVLGQAAYFFAILGAFILSGRLFQRKELSIVLLLALVLTRIYASPWDVVYCFQVTPLRLDLWLPLLAVVYFRGPYHWSAGLVCGLLILLLKSFGIIYTLAYVQLLITLFAISVLDNGTRASFLRDLADFGKRCMKPLAIILCAFTASHLLLHNPEIPDYSGFYRKIGIGFIQISSTSFYWYIPAMISTVFILLFRLRSIVSSTYLTSGLLLTYCAIGNSIYFFGRSHEHNILNISIVLMFLCFFLLDLISRLVHEHSAHKGSFSILRRHGSLCAAIVIVLGVIVYYSDNITEKSALQITQISKGQTIFPLEYDPKPYTAFLNQTRAFTNNSKKVYFVGGQDFEFYYYGGYTPVGYCNPFLTWFFTQDLTRFLQGLLDNGYYLVCSKNMKFLLANLSYNSANNLDQSVVVSKSLQQGHLQ